MNLRDYCKKHHPSSHHKNFRSSVLTPMKDLMKFRAIHMASKERMNTQKKTQLTNMNKLNTIKNDGTNNRRCKYRIATPQQGCARLGNRKFPKNGKQRVCKIPKIYRAVKKMPRTSYVQYSTQNVRKTYYTGHRTYGTSHNTNKCQTDYIGR